jgi:hypothetical protein
MTRRWTISTLLLVFVLISISTSLTKAQDSSTHPRLFFTPADIDQMKTEAETTHNDIWLAIEGYARSIVGTAPPEAAPPEAVEEDFRAFGNQLIPLAFSCVISDDAQICDTTKTYLLTYATWTQWDVTNRRDLGHAHMLVGNALAYDWMYDKLTPEERQTVHDNLTLYAERMFEASAGPYNDEWTNWWSSSYIQNHHWTNNNALGIAALALMDDDALTRAGEVANVADTATCTATASADTVSLRTQPGAAFGEVGTIVVGADLTFNAQTLDADGTNWWRTADGQWVNTADVTAGDACAGVEALTRPELWLDEAVNQLQRAMFLVDGIQDGTWHEGIHYQSYAFSTTLPFLSNLRTLTGIDLLPEEYLKNYVLWRIYNEIPNSLEFIMAFSDFEWWWANAFQSQNILRFIANEYDDPRAEWMAQQLLSAQGERGAGLDDTPWQVFEFFYYDPTIEAEPPTDLPLARAFPDEGAVIWRTGWEPDDLIFGLHAGGYGGNFALQTFVDEVYPWNAPCNETGCNYNAGHDHADAGTFYFYRRGQWLTPEWAGYGVVDTGFHNTIQIEGQNQFYPTEADQDLPESFADSQGTLDAVADTPDFNYVAANVTGRYKNTLGLSDFTRHVLFVRPGYVVMLDNLHADAPHQYFWISHFGEAVTVDGDWMRGDALDDQIMGVDMIAPAPEQRDVITSADAFPYARIESLPAAPDTRFINLFYPTDEAGWDARPDAALVEDTGAAAVVLVTGSEGWEDTILFGYTPTDTSKVAGGYEFDTQIAVLQRGADGGLLKLFASGGTFVTDGGTGARLVSNLDPAQAFEAVYDGSGVAVYGTIMGEVSLYAPTAETLTVNGEDTAFTRDGDNVVFGAQ